MGLRRSSLGKLREYAGNWLAPASGILAGEALLHALACVANPLDGRRGAPGLLRLISDVVFLSAAHSGPVLLAPRAVFFFDAAMRYPASAQFKIECGLDHICRPMLRVFSQIDVSLPDAKVRCGFPDVKSSEHLSIHGRTDHEVRSTAFYLHSRCTRNDRSCRLGQRVRAPLRQLLLRIIGGGFQCAHWLGGGQ